jgi:predicted dehydrogenase
MITGWGSHHIDIAHWALGVEGSGPVEVSASADYPVDGLWDVHTGFSVDYVYANGVTVNCSDDSRNRNGITFIGTEGSIFVTRGSISSDPSSLLNSQTGMNEIRLPRSTNHMRNWLDSIRSRLAPIASVEVGHRSCTACILGDIAMVTGEKLKWDPAAERFLNSDVANGMLSRPMRGCWSV